VAFSVETKLEHFVTAWRQFRPMKTLLAKLTGTLAVLAFTSTLALAKDGWSEDYDKALAQAKAEKKLVLLDFTGSDWCGWCIKLDKEVFSQPEFAEYAKNNVVLVELDYPRSKEQTKEIKAQNAKLEKEYKIQGYPTIVVLDSAGKKVGELGYQPGGPKAFIAALDKLKAK
jgi:protein disulfide-isomerase